MQWLIDIIAARVIDTIGIPPVYIDRGDPAAWDFMHTDLIVDAQWHELDLSAIIPPNPKAVLLTVSWLTEETHAFVKFRKPGNVNEKAMTLITTQVARIAITYDTVVSLSDDQKIEYNIDVTPGTVLAVTVKGWWL